MGQGGTNFSLCLQSLSHSSLPQSQHDLQQLLHEFEDIFQESRKLPPIREIDHHINMKEGIELVNVRPYK